MTSLTTKYFTYGTLLLCSLLLGGCGIARSVGSWLADVGTPGNALTQISIVTKDNANDTSATAVDIVFVYNDTVYELLPKSATVWFSKRDELRSSLRQYIDITSVEIPPTFLLESVPLPDRHSGAVKVVAYANYLDKKGLKPIDLTSFVHPLLTLEAKTINFTEQNKDN
jgi:type VI secretion system protein